MIRHRHNAGFTLIEVLLVVVIMAVLAGAIITRFLGTADDAKTSSLTHNLYVIEAQLEIYRAQHLNRYPTIQDNGLPQLTSATNAAGEMGASRAPSIPWDRTSLEAPDEPFRREQECHGGGRARPETRRQSSARSAAGNTTSPPARSGRTIAEYYK